MLKPTQRLKAKKPCFHGISQNNRQNLRETRCYVLCNRQRLMGTLTVHETEPSPGQLEFSRTAVDQIFKVKVFHCTKLIRFTVFQLYTIGSSAPWNPAGSMRTPVLGRNLPPWYYTNVWDHFVRYSVHFKPRYTAFVLQIFRVLTLTGFVAVGAPYFLNFG